MIAELYILYVMAGLLSGGYVFYTNFKGDKQVDKSEIEMMELKGKNSLSN